MKINIFSTTGGCFVIVADEVAGSSQKFEESVHVCQIFDYLKDNTSLDFLTF